MLRWVLPLIFEGTGYTTVDVSEDGYLSFGTSTFCSSFNDLDNSPANRLPLVAPLWDNLNFGCAGSDCWITNHSI